MKTLTAILPPNNYLTTGQVARLLGVAAGQVKRWCDQKLLPETRIPGTLRERRIFRAHLLLFMRDQGWQPDAIEFARTWGTEKGA